MRRPATEVNKESAHPNVDVARLSPSPHNRSDSLFNRRCGERAGVPPSFEHWPALALGAVWGALDLLMPATFAGIAIGLAANFGPRPALKTSFFQRVIPGLLGVMALVSLLAGIAGFVATRNGLHGISGPLKATLAVEKHPMLAAVWWSSLGGLLALFTCAIIFATWTWRKRAHIAEMLRNR